MTAHRTMAESPRRAAFIFIFITVVLDMLALGMIVPVLPKLVETFVDGNTARAAETLGVFGTAWALMQFIFSPVLGSLSDRFGRRPVVLLSNFGLGLDYLLMANAPTLAWLFVGRVVSGITAATFATAGAYIADVTPPQDRAARFGMLGAAFGIGFILGPAVGGILGAWGPRVPFWVAGGLSLANAMYGTFVLPESLKPENRAPFQWRRANAFGSLTLLRSNRQVLGLAFVLFFGYIAHESLPSMFVLYASYRYGWDTRMVGLMMAAVGTSSMIVSGGLIRPIVGRVGERVALLTALLFGAAGFATYAFAYVGWMVFLGIPMVGLWSMAGPAAQGLMTRRVGASEHGRLQGALSSLRGVAGMIGPGLFTLTFAHFIDPASAIQLPGSPFFVAAALLATSFFVAWRVTAGEVRSR